MLTHAWYGASRDGSGVGDMSAIRQEYEQLIAAGELRADAAQADAISAFERLGSDLATLEQQPQGRGILQNVFRRKPVKEPVTGLYLYGGVGRGKSMLMDMFFASAPINRKRRVHFHAFMQEVHEGLQHARAEGVRDPIEKIAAAIITEAQLLCFDELQITDITDAMIVGRLFQKLFDAGVVVVTTSNRHPTELYKDGLNRKLFLPFIDLIVARLDVLQLDGGQDHRRQALADRDIYFTPLGADATARMDQLWTALAGPNDAPLTILNKARTITLPRYSNGIARADFSELFQVALGPSDYLKIAEAAKILMIDNIPIMNRSFNNEAKRFVTLVDAFYEAGKRLICSAAAQPEQLYQDGAGALAFARTASRLIAMPSSASGAAADMA